MFLSSDSAIKLQDHSPRFRFRWMALLQLSEAELSKAQRVGLCRSLSQSGTQKWVGLRIEELGLPQVLVFWLYLPRCVFSWCEPHPNGLSPMEISTRNRCPQTDDPDATFGRLRHLPRFRCWLAWTRLACWRHQPSLAVGWFALNFQVTLSWWIGLGWIWI